MSGDSGTALERAWVRVRTLLRNEYGDAAFKNWLKSLTLLRASGDKVVLAVTSKFWRDWIAAHYGDRLVALWKAENMGFNGVEIVVSTAEAKPAPRPEPVPSEPPPPPRSGNEERPAAPYVATMNGDEPRLGDVQNLCTPLDPRLTFETFVIGKPNEFAHAAALRVAEADDIPFNPLFLYGGVGLGKTHLMHALAWRMRQRTPTRRVTFLSSETFMYLFVKAVRYKDMHAFKEQFRTVDVLMIDDVQFFGEKSATQEELFHTFNALVDHRRQVIISADKPPVDLQGIEERLKSRLGSGVVAQMNPTNYELRLSILHAKAEQRGVAIPPKVLEFLAHKITSNIRELEGAMIRLSAHATLLNSREISIDMAQEVLQDLLRANDRHVTIDDIQKRVCEHYNIKMSDLLSPRRARAVARPRQVAMYLAKQLTTRSLPEIGRKFGGRDHTTIMHGVRKIEELRGGDPSLNEDIEILTRSLTR
ncbi:MAG: chromosomal replication initiator protein DnaA [Rhodospirillaceae bacterium]|nr:chromosomal replication initiator protein DnaA [Rhodospirillaceae bacterium]